MLTDRIPSVSPAVIVSSPEVTAVKSVSETAAPPAVLHASTVSPAALPESSTANCASPPSVTVDAPVAATETISMPPSSIVVVAGVGSTSAAPSGVDTPVNVTTRVSPGSSTSSA